MADFKVVYRTDEASWATTWEPGCPLCLTAVQVARNIATGHCYLQLKIENISDTTADRLKLTANITYADGSVETVTYEPLDADLPSHYVLRPDPIPLAGSKITSVEAHIAEVAVGKTLWKATGATFEAALQTPVQLPLELAAERRTELIDQGKNPDNFRFLAEDCDTWWHCSCGMPNVGNGRCARCGITREMIFSLQDESTLSLRANERKECQSRREKQRKKILRTSMAAIALIAVALGAAFSYVWLKTDLIFPNSRYDEAMELFESGNYEASYQVFAGLGTIKDAAAMKDACGFELGNQLFREGKFEEADRYYPRTSSSKEAVETSKRAIADETRAEGRLASAASMYDAIDEPELAQEARYQYVTENFEGDYNEHLLGFLRQLAKAEYEDAPELLDQYIAKWQPDHPEIAE